MKQRRPIVQRSEGGFVLIDALAGAALLALAATVIVSIGIGVLDRTEKDLERITALVTIDALAEEVSLRGYREDALLQEVSDISYSLFSTETQSTEQGFVALRLEARSLRDEDAELAFVSLLARPEAENDAGK